MPWNLLYVTVGRRRQSGLSPHIFQTVCLYPYAQMSRVGPRRMCSLRTTSGPALGDHMALMSQGMFLKAIPIQMRQMTVSLYLEVSVNPINIPHPTRNRCISKSVPDPNIPAATPVPTDTRGNEQGGVQVERHHGLNRTWLKISCLFTL